MAVSTPEKVKTIQGKLYDVPRSATKVADIKPEGDSVEFPEIISFNYYESLYESFVSADITIFDSSGKIDKAFGGCGVRQFCAVEITLYDPSYGKDWVREIPFMDFSGANCFYVSRVVNQISRGKKKEYTLELVNKDSLVSMTRSIRNAWPPDSSTKIDYNTVVDDVMKKYIKTSKDTSPVMKEMSESVAKIMGNNMKPYQLINHICSKATPKASGATGGKEETRPAGYVFHETYDEYRFDSIHGLITKNSNYNSSHGSYHLKPINTSTATEKDKAYNILSSKFYDGENQSSLLEEVAAKKRGKPKTKVLDVSRNTFKEIEKLPPKTITDKCLVTAVDEDFGPVTITTQTEYQFEYYNSCDETALDNEPTNPEITSMNYGALLDMLKSKTSTIKVNGNLSLSAGDHVTLELPEIQGEGNKGSEISAKYSGNYLITKINHKVVDIETVVTIMEVCKLVEALMDLNTDFSKNSWYQGKQLGKVGDTLLGWVTSVKSASGVGYYQVRIPAIHGYCDINEKNCDDDVVKKDALPWIPSVRKDGSSSVLGNNTEQLRKGEFVLIRFDGPNFTSPVIVSRHKETNKTFAKKEQFDQSAPYILAPLVDKFKENVSASQGDNGCFKIVTKADKNTLNGTNSSNASKCGAAGSFQSEVGAFIGDFLKIIQDTDGKIGSKFVNSVTGELFEISGYIQKYLAAITGVLRGGISWVKAIITKEVRKGIDKLTKLIMTPIKGVTSVVNDTIEQVLNMVFCSFGDIESLISNMIEDLLNTLVDSAIDSVFGCLDTLIDGIMNEILGEVLSLMENILAAFESTAGLIGGFGDLLGEAINAVLDFLGISCGGSGDCATEASNALVNTFNNPGEYGITAGLKKDLNGGLDAISGVSASIGKETAKLNAEAAEYAKGVELGTANVPGVSSDNEALRNAFTTANNLAADAFSNVFDFCGNLAAGNDGTTGSSTTPTNPDMNDDDTSNPITDPTTPSTTTVVVIGAVNDKYDATYRITPVGSEVDTGGVQKITISRNNTHEDGLIIFAVHLKSTDTARVAGITPGITSGGDLALESVLEDGQYATNPDGMTSPTFPIAGNVVKSEKVYFPAGVKEVQVTVSTLNNQPPSKAYEVNYTATIYRAVDDLDLNKYPYKNLPSTSSALNSINLKIKFEKPATTPPTPTPTVNPPQIIIKNIQYTINNVSVTAGQAAQFQVVRSPISADQTKVKCQTIDGTATNGTHYTGGEAILTFAPGQSTAVFSVPTTADPSLINQSLNFSVKFTDVELPAGNSSNLGGTGTATGTSIGAGVTRVATLNYSTVSTPSPICPAEIILTTPPTTCIVQEDTFPMKIGFIAKTSVPGYTLSYAWERTYDPSGTWSPVANGVRTESVDELVSTFGPTNITVTVSGVPVTLDGWDTNLVTQTPSITYTGATTNELEVTSPSYLINDEEYYRCTITATPDTESIYTPPLTLTTDNIYIGITSDGVFSSTVNCAPAGTLQDGVSITYENSAPNPDTSISVDAGKCTIVEPTQNVDDNVEFPVREEPEEEVTVEDPIPNPSGPFVIPTIDPPTTIPTTPVVVGPDGGIVSVPVPANLPRYKYPPLIPIVGLGFGAIAKADLDDDGRLANIIIKSKGIGYTPSNFNRCGIITSIEITNVGGYYESSPTVYVNDDPTIAFAAIDDEGRVAEIRITNPKNIVYDKIPKIFIQGGGGLGASALAVVTYVPCDEVANRYLNVVNKYNESKLGTVRVVDCP